ncbi:hypothetical protein [Dyella sp.]|uniref:hypothetical protein n=1 Tax=Dyella sp. TaxID=1869338 RepID=UPI002B48108E|nr:hypothetical protein [Dyella sp.]HKT29354.1 hypothetical protein [Dyella sp.]
MRFKRHYPGYALVFGLLSPIAMLCGEAAFASPSAGTVPAFLSHIVVTLENGQPDSKPEDIVACNQQVTAPDSRYLGLMVTAQYWIDPKSRIMNASLSIPSPHTTQRLGYTIPLSPLGLPNQYAFGAFRPKALPDAYVLFSISPDLKTSTSAVLLLNPSKGYNCLVTSDSMPFDSGLSSAYATGKK